ncbi:helicase-related protein [Lactobacillus delbrueckii]
MYALTKSAISNSYLDLAPYLVMGGYYSSKTDFIRQQIKWFDDYHNQVITDNYESGEIEFPIQARMMQEEVLATSGYAPKDLRLLNLLTRRDKGEFGQIHPILIFYQYNKVCEHLIKMIQTVRPDLPIHTVNGHSKDTLRKPHDESAYLVQYEAGGEGLDWQWSNMSVFYEAPIRYEKYIQAKGRNLRNRKLMEHVYHFEF